MKLLGFSNRRLNGKTIDSKGIHLDYDGNYLDINTFNNNQVYHTRLNNEDIIDLLNAPSSKIPLERRIMHLQKFEPYGNDNNRFGFVGFRHDYDSMPMQTSILEPSDMYNQLDFSSHSPVTVSDNYKYNYPSMRIYKIQTPYTHLRNSNSNSRKIKPKRKKTRTLKSIPSHIKKPLRLTYATVKSLSMSKSKPNSRKSYKSKTQRRSKFVLTPNSIPSIQRTIY